MKIIKKNINIIVNLEMESLLVFLEREKILLGVLGVYAILIICPSWSERPLIKGVIKIASCIVGVNIIYKRVRVIADSSRKHDCAR